MGRRANPAGYFFEVTTMLETPLLFPYLDFAMRAVAVLILCALPVLLMPLPAPRRAPPAKQPLTSSD